MLKIHRALAAARIAAICVKEGYTLLTDLTNDPKPITTIDAQPREEIATDRNESYVYESSRFRSHLKKEILTTFPARSQLESLDSLR